jgi:hypothetical protein
MDIATIRQMQQDTRDKSPQHAKGWQGDPDHDRWITMNPRDLLDGYIALLAGTIRPEELAELWGCGQQSASRLRDWQVARSQQATGPQNSTFVPPLFRTLCL